MEGRGPESGERNYLGDKAGGGWGECQVLGCRGAGAAPEVLGCREAEVLGSKGAGAGEQVLWCLC